MGWWCEMEGREGREHLQPQKRGGWAAVPRQGRGSRRGCSRCGCMCGRVQPRRVQVHRVDPPLWLHYHTTTPARPHVCTAARLYDYCTHRVRPHSGAKPETCISFAASSSCQARRRSITITIPKPISIPIPITMTCISLAASSSCPGGDRVVLPRALYTSVERVWTRRPIL